MSVTDNPKDPRLSRGSDETPVKQNDAYLVLSEEEIAKGFVRPLRASYVHTDGCGAETTINNRTIIETYARQPNFYGSTYCVGCSMHRPVSEFRWSVDGEVLGS